MSNSKAVSNLKVGEIIEWANGSKSSIVSLLEFDRSKILVKCKMPGGKTFSKKFDKSDRVMIEDHVWG